MSPLLPAQPSGNATGATTALATHAARSTFTIATIADTLATIAVGIGARLTALAAATSDIAGSVLAIAGIAITGVAVSCRACLATTTACVVVQTTGGSDQQCGQRANHQDTIHRRIPSRASRRVGAAVGFRSMDQANVPCSFAGRCCHRQRFREPAIIHHVRFFDRRSLAVHTIGLTVSDRTKSCRNEPRKPPIFTFCQPALRRFANGW